MRLARWTAAALFAGLALPAGAAETVEVRLWDHGPNSVMMGEGFQQGMGWGMGMHQMAGMPRPMMGVEVDKTRVAAGEVTFAVTNGSAAMVHELIVAPIAGPDVVVPYDAEMSAIDEEALGDLGEVDDLDPGASGALRLTLEPGHYLLFCNIPGHFANGMWVVLEVTG